MIAPVRKAESQWTDGTGSGAPEYTVLVGCGRITQSLGRALEEEGVRASGFERWQEALDEVHRFEPALVVVGAGIPDMDPFEFLARLRQEDADVGILFLADQVNRNLAMEALDRGADDVLPPPHSVSAILLRTQVLAARQQIGNGTRRYSRVGRLEIDVNGRRVLDEGRPVSLTGREFELLNRLIEARGRVVSRQQLLEDIWGSEPSEGVLDATIHRLRKKIEQNLSEPRFVTTVRGIGYRLEMSALGATG